MNSKGSLAFDRPQTTNTHFPGTCDRPSHPAVHLKSFPPSSSQVPGAERGSAGGGRGGAEEAGAHSGQLLPQHCRLQAEAAAVAGSPGQLQRGTGIDRDPVSLSKSQPSAFFNASGSAALNLTPTSHPKHLWLRSRPRPFKSLCKLTPGAAWARFISVTKA